MSKRKEDGQEQSTEQSAKRRKKNSVDGRLERKVSKGRSNRWRALNKQLNLMAQQWTPYLTTLIIEYAVIRETKLIGTIHLPKECELSGLRRVVQRVSCIGRSAYEVLIHSGTNVYCIDTAKMSVSQSIPTNGFHVEHLFIGPGNKPYASGADGVACIEGSGPCVIDKENRTGSVSWNGTHLIGLDPPNNTDDDDDYVDGEVADVYNAKIYKLPEMPSEVMTLERTIMGIGDTLLTVDRGVLHYTTFGDLAYCHLDTGETDGTSYGLSASILKSSAIIPAAIHSGWLLVVDTDRTLRMDRIRNDDDSCSIELPDCSVSRDAFPLVSPSGYILYVICPTENTIQVYKLRDGTFRHRRRVKVNVVNTQPSPLSAQTGQVDTSS